MGCDGRVCARGEWWGYNEVVATSTVTNPEFVAANGQVVCEVDVALPSLALGNGDGKATYFEVKVSDAAVTTP